MNQHESWGPWLALGLGLLLTFVSARGAYWFSGQFIGQQREFQNVVNSAEDAIISTNADLSIRLWNNSAGKIFGYEPEEVLGNPLTDVFDQEEEQRLRQLMSELRDGDSEKSENQMREFQGRRSDGTVFPVELTVSSWNRQGKIMFTIIIREISDRKQREKRLEELTENLEKEVEKRTEELEQFVHAASHDLREPARVMETYAGFLEEDLGDDLDENIRKDLRFIRDSSRQMNELIDSLLSLSRIGRNELETELIEVSTCVDQALEQQEELLRSKEVTIKRDNFPEITADPALLTDLYQNLISNAIKHAGDDSVTISLTAEKNNGRWIFGVRDNGPGIDPEFQETIFEPFKYLKQSDDQDGTGIGLTICRRIVEHHGGDIWVTSQPEGGSHFQFTLG